MLHQIDYLLHNSKPKTKDIDLEFLKSVQLFYIINFDSFYVTYHLNIF